MENNHLLTVEQFKTLARPTSKHVDDDDIMTFVRECEDITIIPAIGLARYKALIEAPDDEANKVLLVGGEYQDKKGEQKRCAGLQLALSYYVYGKLVMVDGGMLTRTGLMQHNDSYASREDDKNRVRLYNDVMNTAETYLASCVAYIHATTDESVKPIRGARLRIHAIGE
jgi:hypothetical protein